MSSSCDVVILGGGAIGLAIALELALQGAAVTVLSRNFQEAALHAAAGMLAPQAEGIPAGPMLTLCLRSRALYPEWVDKLEALSGISSEYWPCGILAPLYGHNLGADAIAQRRPEWRDRAGLDILQPGFSNEVVGGWWFPQDGQVNNQKMAQALLTTVQQLGVTLREGMTIERIVHDDTQVIGIQTTDGLIQSAQYVLASGAWSGALLSIPVAPRKGQMLSIRTVNQGQPLQHVLFGTEAYLVPRRDGRIVIGATNEAVGFTPHNTLAGLQSLLSAALRLYPTLKDWSLEHYWWGFRPATPDELPILGPSPYANLTLATGHYRNGILLMPITAQIVANWVLNRYLDPLLGAFCWSRFGGFTRKS